MNSKKKKKKKKIFLPKRFSRSDMSSTLRPICLFGCFGGIYYILLNLANWIISSFNFYITSFIFSLNFSSANSLSFKASSSCFITNNDTIFSFFSWWNFLFFFFLFLRIVVGWVIKIIESKKMKKWVRNVNVVFS